MKNYLIELNGSRGYEKKMNVESELNMEDFCIELMMSEVEKMRENFDSEDELNEYVEDFCEIGREEDCMVVVFGEDCYYRIKEGG